MLLSWVVPLWFLKSDTLATDVNAPYRTVRQKHPACPRHDGRLDQNHHRPACLRQAATAIAEAPPGTPPSCGDGQVPISADGKIGGIEYWRTSADEIGQQVGRTATHGPAQRPVS